VLPTTIFRKNGERFGERDRADDYDDGGGYYFLTTPRINNADRVRFDRTVRYGRKRYVFSETLRVENDYENRREKSANSKVPWKDRKKLYDVLSLDSYSVFKLPE